MTVDNEVMYYHVDNWIDEDNDYDQTYVTYATAVVVKSLTKKLRDELAGR